MNGVHDMGGMHGMGPIQYESNEPVFHEPWEARVFALNLAGLALGKWTLDAARHAVERIPAPDYLRMSYYERWLQSLVEQWLKAGWPLAPKLRAASRRRARLRPRPRLLRAPLRSAPKSILAPERCRGCRKTRASRCLPSLGRPRRSRWR